MELTAATVNMNLLHSSVSTRILDKAMNHDANVVAALLQDMAMATPAPATTPPGAGLLDIRV